MRSTSRQPTPCRGAPAPARGRAIRPLPGPRRTAPSAELGPRSVRSGSGGHAEAVAGHAEPQAHLCAATIGGPHGIGPLAGASGSDSDEAGGVSRHHSTSESTLACIAAPRRGDQDARHFAAGGVSPRVQTRPRRRAGRALPGPPLHSRVRPCPTGPPPPLRPSPVGKRTCCGLPTPGCWMGWMGAARPRETCSHSLAKITVRRLSLQSQLPVLPAEGDPKCL